MFTKRMTLRPRILGFLIPLLLSFGYLLFKTGTCHAEEKFLKFSGMCDASAGVSLDSDRFIVSNDEDNILRVYMHGSQGIPVQLFNWESYLDITYDFENPEVDIEGATKIGDVIYWIGSHGRNKKGIR